jgi:CRP-like cAMP-binding protein
MYTMYETLLQLPLFQGMNRADFSFFLGKVRLDFVQHKEGEIIIKRGAPCEQLVFVVRGTVVSYNSSTVDGRTRYTVMEYMSAPYLIEPQALFGMNTRYAASYTADTKVSLFIIRKNFVFEELAKHSIFRLNLINLISSKMQSTYTRLWSTMPDGVAARITHFILTHIEVPGGEKRIKIKVTELARILCETRYAVATALSQMQQAGLLEIENGIIVVYDATRLLPSK